jgi:GntR family transcriptional repressor for pyruvate dehydrogenase complex
MIVAPRSVLPFQPPRRRRLHQDVADQLRDAILDGRFAPGDKLPPERELAEEFQVNRTSVREAIKVLEGLGLVSVRQGDGATVRPLIDASFDVLPAMIFRGGRVDLPMLGELNEVVGPQLLEMGRLAIERCQPRDLDELRRLRTIFADPAREHEERARALHDVIVVLSDMTRNRVWQMLARRTHAFLQAEPLREARGRMRRDPGRLAPAMDEALAALEDGRSKDALAALEQIIRTVGDTTVAAPRGRRHEDRSNT